MVITSASHADSPGFDSRQRRGVQVELFIRTILSVHSAVNEYTWAVWSGGVTLWTTDMRPILGIRFKRIKNDWLWLKNFFDPRIGALSRSNMASVTSLFKKLFFEWFDFWILDICFKRSKMIDFGSKIFSIRGSVDSRGQIWRLMTSHFKHFQKKFFEWFDFWILDICFKRSKMIDFRSKIFSMWQFFRCYNV